MGQGRHETHGGPHAEVMALRDARGAAGGSTAYVSLEPCRHHGKTPPCTRALIDAGVRRVVYGARDPDKDAGGGGIELQAAGIEVVGPVWSEARAWGENPIFRHQLRNDRPFVALKLAMTLDGGIASAPGMTTRITGPEAEAEVHRLRSGFDAVMVGAGTVRADAPRLTVRVGDAGRRSTHRIALLPDARLPAGAPLADGIEASPLHVFCRESASVGDRESIVERGGEVHLVAESDRGVDLASVLDRCSSLGLKSVLCEGGSALAGSLLAERLVDRCYLFIAPDLLGPDAVRGFESGLDPRVLADFEPFGPTRSFGRDALIVYDVVGGPA